MQKNTHSYIHDNRNDNIKIYINEKFMIAQMQKYLFLIVAFYLVMVYGKGYVYIIINYVF